MDNFLYDPKAGDEQLTIINQHLWQLVGKSKSTGKGFEVSFKEKRISKSWDQIKGIYRLCGLLAIRFTETYGSKFDLEGAKTHIKFHLGYTRPATDEECLTEALNEKYRLQSKGERISVEQFNALIASFKKDLIKPKSFADATLEEMAKLIDEIEELGVKMDWPEMKLESHEKRAMMEFYGKSS